MVFAKGVSLMRLSGWCTHHTSETADVKGITQFLLLPISDEMCKQTQASVILKESVMGESFLS